MNEFNNNARFQADFHPIEVDQNFSTVEELCLHLMHLKAYEEAAKLAAGKVVLDLGCNNGYGTAALSKTCSRIVGLDVSPRAIAVARQRFSNLPIDFQVFDGGEIPFGDASFDMVVSFQVIEHIDDTKPYLTDIRRVLRPGGIALFTTPNAAIRLDPGMKPWNVFHVREYTAEDLATLLRSVFGDVSVRGLFAAEDLYRVEFNRCQASLNAARQNSIVQPAPLSRQVYDAVAATAKVILPDVLVQMIKRWRGVRRKIESVRPKLAPSAVEKYSTQDVFYREADLRDALDLMAICRV